ncbi:MULTISPECIES: carbohydrate-binding domain-containing protein [Collinsella]|uniref:carbohydrate-binding domain-containing protein n=1 Tax=Collinsella TaxID=102106 RepID=UPI000B7C84A6|nr:MULTISPECIES: carbohydrate-binding domain-containing protein [Collinsella]MBX9027305.1 carbohydrate-binding domain-containing protein [Collinsella aerofaciens]RGL40705.1 carbohydrate-binding domain-containing protein [Collinsella sp. TF06-6AC]
MATLFTTPKRNDKTSGAHFVEPDVHRRTLLAHGSWRRVTRRIVCGLACALTVSSLLMPSVSLAAEWVDVGGVRHEAAAGPTGDAAGTWSWDGADDMKLINYNGGEIKAAGKLNIVYEGKNTVKTEPDYTGAAIKAQDGTSQKAELNITSSNSTDELNVTAEADAIKSTGDLSISGPGTVNTTSTASDGIEAKGDLSITGSGTVNATGGTEGIQSKGKTTIDSSGTVIAKGGEGYGVAAGSDLIIKGGGKVEASSIEEAAIWADGNIDISGGSQVKASSQGDLAVDAEGSLAVTNASLDASGVEYGVYAYKGVTLDHATVTVRTSASGGQAIALITDGDDIVIKNGSIVDAFAEGKFSVAISTRNHQPNVAGGHIYISDSVVKAIARYVETGGDGPDHYSNDQSGEVIPEPRGLNIGIFAQTYEGITPASISIVRSKLTAEGDTAAIFALAISEDGKAIGTIEIEGAPIQAPAGGKIINYRNKEELSGGILCEAGQTIGTGDDVIDSPYDAAVAKSTLTVPPEKIKPEEKSGETKPEGSKPEGAKTTKTVAVAATGAKIAGKLAATGDASSAAIVAAALAGTATIVTGAVVSCKRS